MRARTPWSSVPTRIFRRPSYPRSSGVRSVVRNATPTRLLPCAKHLEMWRVSLFRGNGPRRATAHSVGKQFLSCGRSFVSDACPARTKSLPGGGYLPHLGACDGASQLTANVERSTRLALFPSLWRKRMAKKTSSPKRKRTIETRVAEIEDRLPTCRSGVYLASIHNAVRGRSFNPS
jgi:hypothetical protein